jgi:uncharacterized protein involved in exopolysaccharide biosynthesis
VGLLALLDVLRARKMTVMLAVVVAGLIAFALGALLPKHYQSTARVQVDSLKENLLTGFFEPRVRVSEFLGQQAAVAGSRAVALQVYDGLIDEGYFVRETFEADWRGKTGGELVPGNDARLWAADQLLKKLNISVDALESTLSISFRSGDPAQSSRIANAFATAYMNTILAQRQRRAARNAANFEEETESLQQGITDAQRDLTEFREETGIVGLGAQRLEDIEVELAALTMRLAEARTDDSEARSILRQAREASENDLLTLPLPEEAEAGRQAQARLGAVQVQVQRLSERYGPDYPPYAEAVNEKRALERTIKKAVEDHAEFTARRVSALQGAAKRKKDEVVDLQETKQTYDVLTRRVEASRQNYDLVSNRSIQEELQSRVDVVEVLMLARAVPADRPMTPPLAIIVALGMIAGFFLGATAAVAMELFEGRVRSPEAVAKLMRTSVVAEVTAPHRAKRLAT